MRLLLDSNVIIAAFAARGLCETVVEVCLDSHQLVVSEHLLCEVRRGLMERIKLPKRTTDEIIELLRENAVLLEPADLPADSCRDPNDIPVLGLAVAAQVDCVVTGDKDLLVLKKFRSIAIVSPREFSRLVRGE